ncbi:MAG: 23S rRNA (adenine(2503)-C(2))-methyltransferase RlmN [Gammaproteobacteria bacterium]|nr:23S rRNA (adenine(2503)-C(2))-methyltransferase RlmN [Gammaproteobacteria bacterium]MBQ0840489.1 23S rRNA (adenine(2503)-C(2))-methyltransferase RlmN [Gammaproteobacteria bacterium]
MTIKDAVCDDVSASDGSGDGLSVGKVNLLGMGELKLAAFFESLGEKRFRVKQVMQWMHQRGVIDFDAMSDLSKALRAKLATVAEIALPELVSEQTSEDGTRKWLVRVTGGSCIETVYIPEGNRGTLCVSSQIGCSLDCSFCATGKQGFNRDLSSAEIIGQLWIAAKSLDSLDPNKDRVITNVVLMGMGEPLLNFDNVVEAMNLMMHDCAYGLSKRRVTLSTAGVVPALDKLGDVTDVSLAISLHAPNDELRNQLVPLNRKYPIAELLRSAQGYLEKLPDKRRKITIEYTLMREVNDRPEHARELAALLVDTPCKINLIPFNPFAQSDYQRVSNNALYRFRDILIEAGYTVTLRSTRGDDIDAACGQLAGQVNDKTRRSQRYRQQQDQALEAVRIIPG